MKAVVSGQWSVVSCQLLFLPHLPVGERLALSGVEGSRTTSPLLPCSPAPLLPCEQLTCRYLKYLAIMRHN